MSLQININKGAIPTPQVVAANVVVSKAHSTGNPYGAQALAVTVPICRIDQRGVQYEKRTRGGRVEFRFKSGVLRLTLLQSIFIANNISECASNIWEAHEKEHVQDNQRIMDKMDKAIRRHLILQQIFVNRRWYPLNQFNRIEQTIQSSVGDIFRNFTTDAVRKRDTSAAYSAIRNRISRQCKP